MHLPFYEFEVSSHGFVYQFTSHGPKGDFSMVIQYSDLLNTRFPVFNPLQNMALLGKDPLTGQYNDFINTNNGDLPKIMATVAQTLFHHSQQNPQYCIHF